MEISWFGPKISQIGKLPGKPRVYLENTHFARFPRFRLRFCPRPALRLSQGNSRRFGMRTSHLIGPIARLVAGWGGPPCLSRDGFVLSTDRYSSTDTCGVLLLVQSIACRHHHWDFIKRKQRFTIPKMGEGESPRGRGFGDFFSCRCVCQSAPVRALVVPACCERGFFFRFFS